MKYAPCERFATRMNPKMSENPDESRNRSPPSARPFSDWISQNRTAPQSYCSRFDAFGYSREYTGWERNVFASYFQNCETSGYVWMTVFCRRPFFRSTLRM